MPAGSRYDVFPSHGAEEEAPVRQQVERWIAANSRVCFLERGVKQGNMIGSELT